MSGKLSCIASKARKKTRALLELQMSPLPINNMVRDVGSGQRHGNGHEKRRIGELSFRTNAPSESKREGECIRLRTGSKGSFNLKDEWVLEKVPTVSEALNKREEELALRAVKFLTNVICGRGMGNSL